MAKPAEPENPFTLAVAPVDRINPPPDKQPARHLLADQEAAIGADQQCLFDRFGIELGDRAARARAGVEHRKRQRAGLVGGVKRPGDGRSVGNIRLDGQRTGLVDQSAQLLNVAGGQNHAKAFPAEKARQRGAKTSAGACNNGHIGCHIFLPLRISAEAFRQIRQGRAFAADRQEVLLRLFAGGCRTCVARSSIALGVEDRSAFSTETATSLLWTYSLASGCFCTNRMNTKSVSVSCASRAVMEEERARSSSAMV